MSCDMSWENMPEGAARTAAYDLWLCCCLQQGSKVFKFNSAWEGKYLGCPGGGKINYAIPSVPSQFMDLHIYPNTLLADEARAYSESYGKPEPEEPTIPTLDCDESTPNFNSIRELLLYMDTNHTGIISMSERDNAWELQSMGHITYAEAQFVEDAYNAGSINALCAEAYVSPTEGKGEFVGEITVPSVAKVGENVVIYCKYRNIGTGASYFDVRAVDGIGKELGRSGFKHLVAGSSNYGTVTFSMPNYSIINGTFKLIKRT